MANGSQPRTDPINFRCRCEKGRIQDFFSFAFAMKDVFFSLHF